MYCHDLTTIIEYCNEIIQDGYKSMLCAIAILDLR